MNAKSTLSRNIAAAAIAIVATIAFHGGWLSGVDADAIAVTAPAGA
jgi:hypothetical protein